MLSSLRWWARRFIRHQVVLFVAFVFSVFLMLILAVGLEGQGSNSGLDHIVERLARGLVHGHVGGNPVADLAPFWVVAAGGVGVGQGEGQLGCFVVLVFVLVLVFVFAGGFSFEFDSGVVLAFVVPVILGNGVGTSSVLEMLVNQTVGFGWSSETLGVLPRSAPVLGQETWTRSWGTKGSTI